jgi:hypothetical protein
MSPQALKEEPEAAGCGSRYGCPVQQKAFLKPFGKLHVYSAVRKWYRCLLKNVVMSRYINWNGLVFNQEPEK